MVKSDIGLKGGPLNTKRSGPPSKVDPLLNNTIDELVKKEKEFRHFLEEISGYGIDQRAAAFSFWKEEFQTRKKRIRRSDFYGRPRLLPTYEREDALFNMARFALDEWERQIVIESFLEEYALR